jgi:hypothetical protein
MDTHVLYVTQKYLNSSKANQNIYLILLYNECIK